MKDLVDIFEGIYERVDILAEIERGFIYHPPAEEEERDFLAMIIDELHDGQETLEK